MADVVEIIKARSDTEAYDTIASLYPTATEITLLARRNERGQFSTTGHTFQFAVVFIEEEPPPEELGEDEY